MNTGFWLFSCDQHVPSSIILETLTIASHRFLINAPDQLLTALQGWTILLDPSLTISHSPPSFSCSVSLHGSLCLAFQISLTVFAIYQICRYLSNLVPVSLSIKYHTQHSVLLCSCMGVIQSKLHQHSNQSRNLSCCLSTPEERLTCEPSPRCHSLKLLQECKGLQAQSSSWGQFIVFSEKYPSLMQGLEII